MCTNRLIYECVEYASERREKVETEIRDRKSDIDIDRDKEIGGVYVL